MGKHTNAATDCRSASLSEQARAAWDRLEVTHGTYYDEYFGNGADLVAAGIVTASQLPAKGGMATFLDGERISKSPVNRRRSGYVRIHSTGRRYRVTVCVSQEEEKRREGARAMAHKQEQAREADALLGDPESLRRAALALVRQLGWLIGNHAPGEHQKRAATFLTRFAAEGVEDVLDALAEVHDWLETVAINVLDSAPLQLSVARSDSAFQAFLASQCLKD